LNLIEARVVFSQAADQAFAKSVRKTLRVTYRKNLGTHSRQPVGGDLQARKAILLDLQYRKVRSFINGDDSVHGNLGLVFAYHKRKIGVSHDMMVGYEKSVTRNEEA
jgi:hypothetical protein